MAASDESGEMDIRDLMEALHTSSFGWAMSCCNYDHEEALDVLQTAYLKVLEGEGRFNGQSSHKTWLFGIIRWTAANRRRRRLLRALLLERWSQRLIPADPVPSLEAAADAGDEARRVRAMLTRLPGRQRQVLHLVFYEETTIEEASSILGISVGSARVHYHRGKAALRAMLVVHPEGGMETAHERA